MTLADVFQLYRLWPLSFSDGGECWGFQGKTTEVLQKKIGCLKDHLCSLSLRVLAPFSVYGTHPGKHPGNQNIPAHKAGHACEILLSFVVRSLSMRTEHKWPKIPHRRSRDLLSTTEREWRWWVTGLQMDTVIMMALGAFVYLLEIRVQLLFRGQLRKFSTIASTLDRLAYAGESWRPTPAVPRNMTLSIHQLPVCLFFVNFEFT